MTRGGNEAVETGVVLTARVHAAEGSSGGYDLTNENGKVKIKKFGVANATPEVDFDDLKKALDALGREV